MSKVHSKAETKLIYSHGPFYFCLSYASLFLYGFVLGNLN